MREWWQKTHEQRKEWKASARPRLKKHYWMALFVCLVMAMTGIGYNGAVSRLGSKLNPNQESESIATKVVTGLLEGRSEESRKLVEEYRQNATDRDRHIGAIALEHTRGVTAGLLNDITSGQIFESTFSAIQSIVRSHNAAIVIFILLAMIVFLVYSVLLLNVIAVIFKRVMLEARIYDHVPIRRFLYLIRVRKWLNVARVMFVKTVFQLLWYLTVVGGVIKSYSYMMVPYIIAENPSLTPKQAITLSRQMMDGHKWEAACLNLSFFPWDILEVLTFGISSILFTNPYREAVRCEYYAQLRKQAIEKNLPGCELLTDTYLFERAEETLLKETYADAETLIRQSAKPEKDSVHSRRGIAGWLSYLFGIILVYDEKEKQYETEHANAERLLEFRQIMSGQMYPGRLFPARDEDRIRPMKSIYYDRHYSVSSLIIMFFMLCFVGWLWEVSLHLITNGEFSNRGVLHGPWLPIYGTGGIIVLLLLNRLRKNPLAELIAAVILCGSLEYYTGWYLEMTHNGQKWWDYSGYFLNIDGRVCAEGLLVFGLGGIAFVYLLAPFLDNMLRYIPRRIAVTICCVLLIVFTGDQIYSKKHPNQGRGITDIGYESETEA